MGGFFGVVSKESCVSDLFFGVDYHSHLGTRRGGMATYSPDYGFERAIHNIENSPFRTKFEKDVLEMKGNLGIGCISDNEPQPLIIRSHLGSYAITTVGRINNEKALVEEAFQNKAHFQEMSGTRINATELVATLINQRDSLVEGISYAQSRIDGSMSILILSQDGIYAARDRMGRTPVAIGGKEGAFCCSFESFAYLNLGYHDIRELGPGEIVLLTPEGIECKSPPREEMKICAFLWTYYGYPPSTYEGVNVEAMRMRCGSILARNDHTEVDYVVGIPDSGIPHAIGYANQSGIPFARSFIKYTPTWPRSFMPPNQEMRNLVAHMKMLPVQELIEGKRLLCIDDSIVRGTQIRGPAQFLYDSGAKEVHIRSACPPILFSCQYLNFSRSTSDMDLITRRAIQEMEGDKEIDFTEYVDPNGEKYQRMVGKICEMLNFNSLGYQTVAGSLEAIGLPACKVCTYCWNGKI